jgi:hypothetical protein
MSLRRFCICSVRQMIFLALLLAVSIPSAFSQTVGRVENVRKDDVLPLVSGVLKAHHTGLLSVETDTRDLLSNYEEFRSHLMQYRARYRFRLDGTTLLVSMENLQVPGHGTWNRALIPADGAKAKLIAQMVEQLNAANQQRNVPQADAAAIPAAGEHRNAPADSPRPPSSATAKSLVFDPVTTRCAEEMCAVRKDGLWGFVDYSGNLVLDFQYQSSNYPFFSQGVCIVRAPNSAEGQDPGFVYIDKKGAVLFGNKVFQSARPFVAGFATVTLAEKVRNGVSKVPAVLDLQGHILRLAAGVQQNTDFHDGLIVAQGDKSSKYGFRDTKMHWAVRPIYDQVQSFSDGKAWVAQTTAGGVQKWGAINTEGKAVVPFQFSTEPQPFTEGFAVIACSDGASGYVDDKGYLALACQYSSANRFVHGHAFVVARQGALLIDTQGNATTDGKHLGISPASVASLSLRADGAYYFVDAYHGLLDDNWRMSIPPSYLDIGLFPPDGNPAGLAWAVLPDRSGKTRQGFINRRGEFVLIQERSKF